MSGNEDGSIVVAAEQPAAQARIGIDDGGAFVFVVVGGEPMNAGRYVRVIGVAEMEGGWRQEKLAGRSVKEQGEG